MSLQLHADRFAVHSNVSQEQFYNIYQRRLAQISPSLRSIVPQPIAEHINQIVAGKKCSIIGVVYKDLATRTNILNDYKELGGDSSNDPPLERSDNDKLYCEDETGRVHLIIDNVQPFVNGCVLGFSGVMDHSKFKVDEVFFPEPLPVHPLSPAPEKIAFVSCLAINSSKLRQLHTALAQELKQCSLVVFLGNQFEQEIRASQEAKSFQDKMKSIDAFPVTLLQSYYKFYEKDTILMPGQCDPVSVRLPQAPYHRCLIPNQSFHLATNPCAFTLANNDFVCVAGETPLDIIATSSLEYREAVESLLKLRHLSPVAPDHLPCYSLTERDPFVLENAPSVLVVGNAPAFSEFDYNGTKIITVPSFSASHEAVFLDLQTGNAESKHFEEVRRTFDEDD